jgi:aspartyl-tRNA(Asn)/glutamyl-tRNA(Gln) amidotransferase subunit A
VNKDALHALTARDCAARVQRQELSAVEVARVFIARVERDNPALNAIIQFDPQQVLAEAATIDRRIAAGEQLPLAGVPFTAKDNMWVAGRRVSQGSRLFDGFVAPRDAWSVARWRAAGGVLLGITNCSEFACKGITDNLLYGPTHHPLDNTLTPGGSSGGAAAATMAGLGLLALGTDAGGSVRRPAAHCGLVGIKPSPGLVPHPWGFAEPNYGVSVVGVLARDAADCALACDALYALDAADVSSMPLDFMLGAVAAQDTPPPRELRIAWSPQLGRDFAIDEDVLEGLQRVVNRLRAAGWTIHDADPEWPEWIADYALTGLQHAGLHALYGEQLATRRDDIDANLVEQIEAGALLGPDDLLAMLQRREIVTAHLSRFFADHDLLLCPSAPVTAWPLDQVGPPRIGGKPAGPRGHAAYTPLFNHCGVPACSVPAGTVRGLPIGLQVIAPRYEDKRVLQFAAWVEAVQREAVQR